MTKTIYLHIGTPKTGTSSIQQYLSTNAEVMKDNGYFVPQGKHSELSLSLINEYYTINNMEGKKVSPDEQLESNEVWTRFLKKIDNTQCENVVISDEDLSILPTFKVSAGGDLVAAKLKHFLKKYKVRVVVYLRPIPDQVNSLYKESIKNSPNIQSYEQQIGHMMKHMNAHVFPSKCLDYFSDLFGKDSLVIRRYSRNEFFKGDVVCDFLRAIDYPTLDTDDHIVLHENMSIPDEYIDMKRLFNIAGIKDKPFNLLMAKYLIQIKSVITRDKKDIVYKQLNELMDQEVKTIKDKYSTDIGSDVRVKGNAVHSPDAVEGFVITMLGHVILQNQQLLSRLDKLESAIKSEVK